MLFTVFDGNNSLHYFNFRYGNQLVCELTCSQCSAHLVLQVVWLKKPEKTLRWVDGPHQVFECRILDNSFQVDDISRHYSCTFSHYFFQSVSCNWLDHEEPKNEMQTWKSRSTFALVCTCKFCGLFARAPISFPDLLWMRLLARTWECIWGLTPSTTPQIAGFWLIFRMRTRFTVRHRSQLFNSIL